MWFLAIPAAITFASIMGVINTGSRARRVFVVFVSALVLVVPFVLPMQPAFLRGFLGLGVAFCLMRQIEIAVDARPIPAIRRAMHASLMMELRRTPRVKPRLDGAAVVRLLVQGTITAGAIWTIATIPSDARGLALAARGLAAIVMSLTAYDAFCAVARIGWGLAGFDLPRLHDDPHLSRSVGEFWGERWNRVVGQWLRAHCFMPLARRRRGVLGLCAAFAASALLHVYIAWAALDARAALMWAVFFLAQIPIFLVERALRVTTWRPALARVWTIGVLVLVSPFFIEPVLRGFDFYR